MTQNPSCLNPTHFPHEPFNCSYAAKQSGESWYFTKDRLLEQFPHPPHLVSLSGSLETTGIENSQAWATQATQFLPRFCPQSHRQTTKLQLQWFRKITSLHLNPTWIQHPWCPWHLAETEQLKHCTNLRKKLIQRKPVESKKLGWFPDNPR